MTRTIARPIALAAFLFLGGCASMAPTYTKPAPPVAGNWPAGPSYKAEQPAQKPLAEIPWQEFFVEPQLQKLVTLALDNNRDLKVAVLNMDRYRALYQIKRADLLPTVTGDGAVSVRKTADDLAQNGNGGVGHSYNVSVGISSYELDLFGRIRSLKDQALEQYLATEQARRSVQITLVSQVANAYLTLGSDLERLQLAKDTLANQQESYRLSKSRFEAGVSSALDLQQAQTSVDSARVDIARYTTLVAQDLNALTLVVGSDVPQDLMPKSLTEALTAVKDVAPGLPSDVLLSRPDILQAEYNLKGANANIGAARAAFFPRIALTTSVGFGSDQLSGLFKGGNLAWSFAPSISVPIFEGGRNKANLEVAKVDRDIAVAQYEKAIQIAFREVADALAQRGTIDEQVAAQQSLTGATAETFRLSQARYQTGIDSYLNVLDAQRSLYVAQQNLITTRLARLNNMVTLYKVLGGGSK
ncbi:AdeC/AdeK/OprM family multidrug efflux complex outer membrane factor [Geomonas subterranea]|uniref:AdeC/AdeK/OprM family multidrug efflux complex outer membrane factor n=1 Tax=Geomonas subterranea TaxID=2847989 RepID=UPI001CD49DD6|nr:AdeC/AdeK/OprM family multidrug efflux complex outer membrane factor [Geomonas fuzhouensis]